MNERKCIQLKEQLTYDKLYKMLVSCMTSQEIIDIQRLHAKEQADREYHRTLDIERLEKAKIKIMQHIEYGSKTKKEFKLDITDLTSESKDNLKKLLKNKGYEPFIRREKPFDDSIGECYILSFSVKDLSNKQNHTVRFNKR